MNFLALDVETANPDLASICQIAVVPFINGTPQAAFKTLINPESEFDEVNMSIHGITPRSVRKAPIWADIVGHLHQTLTDQIVVTHGSFDRVAIHKSCDRYNLFTPPCTWLDTCMVARRAWPDVARSGYGLFDLAERFSIEFQHHDAEEDARATGLVLLQAINQTGHDLPYWLQRVRQPIDPAATPTRHATKGNEDGPLHGHTIAFTGTLTMRRADAAQHAAQSGCNVTDSVTKKTTLLVVGEQDVQKLAGHALSSKHRKAEELIAKGSDIRILSENDFLTLVGLD